MPPRPVWSIAANEVTAVRRGAAPGDQHEATLAAPKLRPPGTRTEGVEPRASAYRRLWLALAATVALGVAVVVGNLVADLFYGVVDPRVRTGHG